MHQKPLKGMLHEFVMYFHFCSGEFSKQPHPRAPGVRIVATNAGIQEPGNQTAM